MKGFINGNTFRVLIDSGSPVTIFAIIEIKNIMQRKDLQVLPMIKRINTAISEGTLLNYWDTYSVNYRWEVVTSRKQEF